jgi:hypothetical protein
VRVCGSSATNCGFPKDFQWTGNSGLATADVPELLTRVPVLVDNSDFHSQNAGYCGLLLGWSLLFHLYFLFIHCADFITQEQLNA